MPLTESREGDDTAQIGGASLESAPPSEPASQKTCPGLPVLGAATTRSPATERSSRKGWVLAMNAPAPRNRRAARWRHAALAAAVAGVLLACGCTVDANAASPGATPPRPEKARARDDLGRTVALSTPARRIAALAPGFTEILFAIGCGDRVVVRDRWSDHPAAAKRLPATDGLDVRAAQVAGFEPDLVLLHTDNRRDLVPFERVGLRVAALQPLTYEQVARDVERIGRLCGGTARARALAGEMREVRQNRARQREARPSLYVEVDGTDPARPWTSGEGTFVHELVELAGGRNVLAGSVDGYAQVSAEAVVRADPDYILLLNLPADEDSGESALARRPGFSQLAAVREGRVIDDIDADLLTRPGPRLARGLALLSDALDR